MASISPDIDSQTGPGSGHPGAVRLPSLQLYPERADIASNWQRRVADVLPLKRRALSTIARRRFVRRVNRLKDTLTQFDESAFQAFVNEVRADLLRHGFADDVVVRSYAAIREAASRCIGLTHFDVQIQGGYALLHGAIAELETGEGKTLTATLAAGTAALAGIAVHVITVNDYLANRDAEAMGPVYRALGLDVGVVVSGLGQQQRRDAYNADITYCTNKEVAFDYLRDRMALGYVSSNVRGKLSRLFGARGSATEPVMRGLQFAIVDEADSVLIDEARTPLIISGRSDPEQERKLAEQALQLVESLQPDEHFRLRRDNRQIELTQAGKDELQARAAQLAGSWRGAIYREERARHALSALNLFHRDEHYLLRNDKIEIIDENTGRVMPDRSWGEGLHQMIEVKEGCTVTGVTLPLARMTYQRFFRRYKKLSGMTGTASEARRELWSVYRLSVVTIATNRALARKFKRTRIFRRADAKWQHIVARTQTLRQSNVPVLIGTRSVASSELASQYLTEAGIEHQVLNAAQDEHEARIIAQAGEASRVTVATNMAGRGVDIRLGADVLQRGGLHVIMSERHDSQRIDRQLFGRCARQGEPGHVEIVLSLEDSLVTDSAVRVLPLAVSWYRSRVFSRAQQIMEARYARTRRELMHWDQRMGTALAFTGRLE